MKTFRECEFKVGDSFRCIDGTFEGRIETILSIDNIRLCSKVYVVDPNFTRINNYTNNVKAYYPEAEWEYLGNCS